MNQHRRQKIVRAPTEFRFELDAWEYQYNSVELQSGKLVCRFGDNLARFAEPLTVEPTAERWQEFRDAADAARVWEWARTYETMCLDGTSWSLTLRWGDKTVESEGFNAYPGGTETDYAADSAFGIFEAAVHKLVGQRKRT